MKKILWVINPLQFREQDLEYPQYVSRIMDGKLTGVFLENHHQKQTSQYEASPVYNYKESLVNKMADDEKQKEAEAKKQSVIKTLQQKALCVNVHQDGGIPLVDLITESRYADILLIDAGLSFDEDDKYLPTFFVRNVLTKAECPVLVMPGEHREIREIIFTYRGNAACVFAIKQFTYLFPGLKDLRTTVLYAPENDSRETLEKKRFMAELIRSHYSNVDFKILHGNLNNVLFPEILLKENAIITFGGYGSNNPSRSFYKPGTENAIHSINLPIFITQRLDLASTAH